MGGLCCKHVGEGVTWIGRRVHGYDGSTILFKPVMMGDSNVTLSIPVVTDQSLSVEIPFITFVDISVKWNVSHACVYCRE